jgi:hypothetical protein
MRSTRRLHTRIIGVLGGLALYAAHQSGAAANVVVASTAAEAFQAFWDARNASEAAKAAADVIAAGVPFDEAFKRLKTGRTYSANVKRGVVRLAYGGGSRQFFYDLNVPDTYDPRRQYQVRFQLHGGVNGRTVSEPRGDGTINLPGAEQIYIIPYSWANAPWWSDLQIENLRTILDSVKRTYNVDENRVILSGVSDGATATYYFAMRDTTPFSAFMSLNGLMMVLANSSIGAANALCANNLLNKPFFMVNGGKDPLYPTRVVDPLVEHLKKGGVTVEYLPQPEGEHNTRWWPTVKDAFEAFAHAHPREPFPEKLTWSSGASERSNRAHWLVVDHIAGFGTSDSLPDLNRVVRPSIDGGPPRVGEFFRHDREFGRVDLVRSGNTVQATTKAVTEFTLLLSPDVFDFSKPVKVVVDGKPMFEGRVEKNLPTLMKWAARDNDRTMLFGAEVHIKVQ